MPLLGNFPIVCCYCQAHALAYPPGFICIVYSIESPSKSATCNGHILTGTAKGDDVYWRQVCPADGGHISVVLHLRQTLRRDPDGKRLDLTAPHRSDLPGQKTAQWKTPGAIKEAAEGQLYSHSTTLLCCLLLTTERCVIILSSYRVIFVTRPFVQLYYGLRYFSSYFLLFSFADSSKLSMYFLASFIKLTAIITITAPIGNAATILTD